MAALPKCVVRRFVASVYEYKISVIPGKLSSSEAFVGCILLIEGRPVPPFLRGHADAGTPALETTFVTFRSPGHANFSSMMNHAVAEIHPLSAGDQLH